MKYAKGLERHKDTKVKTRDAGVERAGEEVKEKKGGVDERKKGEKTTDFNAEDDGNVTREQSQSVKNRMRNI